MKQINPEGLLNNAVAFHKAGDRCYRDEPSNIAPEVGDVFLGSPCIVCYAFSIELYLKLAEYLRTGKYHSEHRLDVLFTILDQDISDRIEEHYGLIHPALAWNVEQELKAASKAFIEWRYVHEGGLIEADPETFVGLAPHCI